MFVVTKRVTGNWYFFKSGQATSKKDLSASSTLIPIVFFGNLPSFIIVSIIKSTDLTLYLVLVNSFKWLSNCSIVILASKPISNLNTNKSLDEEFARTASRLYQMTIVQPTKWKDYFNF